MILNGTQVSSFGGFVFEIWVLQVLRASVFVFECFVFETTVPGNKYISLVTKRPSVGKINIVLNNFA